MLRRNFSTSSNGVMRSDLPWKKIIGGSFRRIRLRRTEPFGGLRIGKTIGGRPFGGGVDQGAEKDERLRTAVEPVDRRQILGLRHGGEQGQIGTAAGTADGRSCRDRD